MNSLNPVMNVRTQLADVFTTHRPAHEPRRRGTPAARSCSTSSASTASRLSAFPHELSGGMRQRVMIAMALALDPQVMIMDEPTTALDVVVQRGIIREIMRLRERLGFAVIFITHDLPLLIEISDRIAIMRDGRIVEEDTAEQIYHDPQADYTRHLLSSFPSLTGARGRPSSGRRCRMTGALEVAQPEQGLPAAQRDDVHRSCTPSPTCRSPSSRTGRSRSSARAGRASRPSPGSSPSSRRRPPARCCSTAGPPRHAASAELPATGADGLPGPVRLAEPVPLDQPPPRAPAAHPPPRAVDGGRPRPGRRAARTGAARRPARDLPGTASARAVRRPAAAGGDRPGARSRARGSSSPTSRSRCWTCRSGSACSTCSPTCSATEGLGVLYITHDLATARHFSDEILVHVPRPDRRTRTGRRGDPQPAARVHQGAPRGRSRPRPPRGAARRGPQRNDRRGHHDDRRHTDVARLPERPGGVPAAARARTAEPVAARGALRHVEADRRPDDRPPRTRRTDQPRRGGVRCPRAQRRRLRRAERQPHRGGDQHAGGRDRGRPRRPDRRRPPRRCPADRQRPLARRRRDGCRGGGVRGVRGPPGIGEPAGHRRAGRLRHRRRPAVLHRHPARLARARSPAP